MPRTKWLASLKSGDEVAIVSHRRTPVITQVESTTPAQVQVMSQRYWSKDGKEVGSRSRPWEGDRRLEPVLDKHRRQVELCELKSWVRELADSIYSSPSSATLEQLWAMKRAFEANKGKE
jgi:hypothetical protein